MVPLSFVLLHSIIYWKIVCFYF